MSLGDYCFLPEWDEKASAGTRPAGRVARAGPRGVRSDGDERALGRVSLPAHILTTYMARAIVRAATEE